MNQQRYRDLPGPKPTGSGAGNFPAIEPDGTSTSNPSIFPGTINLDTFDNFYVGVLDWVLHTKLYANVGVGLYDYGTHGSGAGTQLRHVFGASNFQFPEIPAALQNVNTFADYPSSSVTVFDDFKRHTVTGDLTYYASKWGEHMIKGGLQDERIGNERLGGAQYPTVTLNWGQVRAALDGRRVGGTYGHYAVTRVYNSGDIHTNGVGVFLQDSWTPGKNLTLNVGIRTDKEETLRTHRGTRESSLASRTRSRRERVSRGTSSGTVEWKGTAASGSSTTRPNWKCREDCSARSTRSPTTTRSTRSTGQPFSAAILRRQVLRALARSSSRWIFATPPTRPIIS